MKTPRETYTARDAGKPMNTFADQVVLITGAGSGIGRQFALALGAEGARIAAVDCNAAALKALESEFVRRPFASAVADVTDAPAVAAAVHNLETRLGPTDLHIASAGLGRETSALDYQADVFAELIRVNLIGVSNSIAAVLPGMRERRRGHLTAVSSLASWRGLPRMAGYCASKAGVNALLDALRVELKPLNIAVTTLCPGWIRTPMTDAAGIPDSVRMLNVEDAVRRMIDALRRRRAFYAFPAHAVWQVRLIACLPRRIADWLTARYLRKADKPAPGRDRQGAV
jgi:NAD(P)-dependent dehydrogenase (short-subunit alcohol dehydrogenase family)